MRFFLVITCVNIMFAQHSLTVTIKGIESIQGTICFALVNSENTFLTENPYKTKIIKINEHQVTTVFDSIPYGEYALQVFHDINNNKELDKNFLGVPTEPYVFSNHAAELFGPPSFGKAKFEFSSKSASIILDISK